MSVSALLKNEFILVQTREQFLHARTVLLDADEVALDTETTKTDVWTDRYLIGLSTYCEIKGRPNQFLGFYFPFRHNHDRKLFPESDNLPLEWLRELAPALEREDCLWILHNAGFDINILLHEGINLGGRIRDTQNRAHLVDENFFNYELATIAKYYCGISKLKEELKNIEKALGGWDIIPPHAMGLYAVRDVEATFKAEKEIAPKLTEDGLDQLWDDDEKYVRCLAEVMRPGILLDCQKAQELSHHADARMAEIQLELGFDPQKKVDLARKLFVSAVSNPQGFEIPPSRGLLRIKNKVYFPNGLPVVDEAALEWYATHHPECQEVVRLVLEYRGLQKAKSTWYDGFLALVGSDRRLHPGLKQHGTKTGRLSSSKPNLQQIPRDITKSPVKTLFQAPQGYELWEYDYSQAELRLITVYSADEKLDYAYREGADLHAMTRDALDIMSVVDNPDTARWVGKQCNFAICYLCGAEKLQTMLWKLGHLEVSEDHCRSFIEGWHDLYPAVKRTAYRVIGVAEKQGQIKYWNGRKRHIPHPRKVHAYKAWNSLIQGGTGQIMKIAMLKLWEDPEFTSQMVNQVHDSLWIYHRKEDFEIQDKLVKEAMGWATEHFSFPFPVDAKRIAG